MAKVNIDLEKLVCALMKRYYLIHNIDRSQVKCWLDNVLEDCGIEYKDGSLHYIGEKEVKEPVNFEDFPREEQLKWYICTKSIPQKDGGFMPLFCEGEHAPIEKIFSMCPELRNDVALFVEHFRKVTEDDLPEKPDTIKFNGPDTKKYKFVDLYNPSTPIPITRISWKLYTSSHSDSSHQHSEELLLFLLTKGYQRYQEELQQNQHTASQHKEFPLSSTFEHDVKALQEDLRYILDVNWNPECDYNYPKK